jgi:glycosyltransferase involved in cell wall biosynthesis
MIHVAVIVITYRRRDGLVKLLNALQEQRFPDPARSVRLSVIVVDNDAAGSAAPSVEPFRSSKTLTVRYVLEPIQGIPLARNAGISAVPDEAEFFCFIDDDEWPGPTWIDELLIAQRATGADCVVGEVVPVYPEGALGWLVKSRLFESWRFPDRAPLRAGASNNVLISTAFIRRTGHRFDERMRMTGGSDYHFFRQAVALGMRIVWSARAPVYEDVPASRLTLRWIVQRQYRLGITFSLSERIVGTCLGVVTWALKGVGRASLGAVMLPALFFSPYYGMRSIIHLIRGIGTVAGAFGQVHEEYSPESVARDRSGQNTNSRV